MNEEKLFDDSLSFIKSNLDATFDAVPGHLRDYWRITDKSKQGDPYAMMQWGIFTYALVCFKESKNIGEPDMLEHEVFDLFCDWQLILFFGANAGKSNVSIQSIKLFDFDVLGSELKKIVKDFENE